MAEPGGAEITRESLYIETDVLVLLDIDRTSFDTDAFASAVGDLAVTSFGVSREYIEHEQQEAESTPGQSFNVVSSVRRALNGSYQSFERALLDQYEPEAFTHTDALTALQILEAADIPVMAMTHGIPLDQRFKLTTSPALSRLPIRIVDAPNKGEVLKGLRREDGRYYLEDEDGRVAYAAKWIAMADDKIENFAALDPNMRVVPFYLPGRSRTNTDIELGLALVEVDDLQQFADSIVRLREHFS